MAGTVGIGASALSELTLCSLLARIPTPLEERGDQGGDTGSPRGKQLALFGPEHRWQGVEGEPLRVALHPGPRVHDIQEVVRPLPGGFLEIEALSHCNLSEVD